MDRIVELEPVCFLGEKTTRSYTECSKKLNIDFYPFSLKMELILSGTGHIILNESKLSFNCTNDYSCKDEVISIVNESSGTGRRDLEIQKPISRITLRGNVSMTLINPKFASSLTITTENESRIFSLEKIEINTLIIRTENKSSSTVPFAAKYGFVSTHDKSVLSRCHFENGSVKALDRSILDCRIDSSVDTYTTSSAMFIYN